MTRLSTGVPGLDAVLGGGLPAGRTVLVAGEPGTGKTVLAEQVLFHRAARGERALFLTALSEPHDKLLRHAETLSWYAPARVGREIQYLSLAETATELGLHGAAQLALQAARDQRASVVVLDAFRGLRDLAEDAAEVRRFLFDLGGRLGILGATVLVTGEYDRADVARYPEFMVVDGVLFLSLEVSEEHHRRRLEVVKLRGSSFLEGRHTLRLGRDGATVFPRHQALHPLDAYEMGAGRLGTGVPGLDEMLGGGLIAHSFTAVVGPPGTGKTLIGLQFLAEGARAGEPGVMLSLDESPQHLEQRAHAFKVAEPGRPFFDGDRLRLVWAPAVEVEPDVVAQHLRDAVEAIGARRVVLDAFGNLDTALPPRTHSDFVVALVNYLRRGGATALLVHDMPDFGADMLPNPGVASTADNVVRLRYVPAGAYDEPVLSVVKVRDSAFDRTPRRFAITERGLAVGAPSSLPTGG